MRYNPPIIVTPTEEIDLPREGRFFREVIEAVQNGLEQLGEQCSKSEYDFKKPDDVDMHAPVTIFVEKMDIGAQCSTGDYTDRLADRLGIDLATGKEKEEPNE